MIVVELDAQEKMMIQLLRYIRRHKLVAEMWVDVGSLIVRAHTTRSALMLQQYLQEKYPNVKMLPADDDPKILEAILLFK